MKITRLAWSALLVTTAAWAGATMPHFTVASSQGPIALLGQAPSEGKTTEIPTLLVPVTLNFSTTAGTGKPTTLSASPDVPAILDSPIFKAADLGVEHRAQYLDALLASTVHHAAGWHTLLGAPTVHPVTLNLPPSAGYVLHQGDTGRKIAVVDVEYLEKQIFAQLQAAHAAKPNTLVLVVTPNTTFYTWSDATICCSTGTHGIDPATGLSFVMGSYFHDAPAIASEQDIQPLTEQLAEYALDPTYNPLYHGGYRRAPGNHFTSWLNPHTSECAGTGIASDYFLLEPTDTNLKNNFVTSPAYAVESAGRSYHLQNVALLNWYRAQSKSLTSALSFPNRQALTAQADPCMRGPRVRPGSWIAPTRVQPIPSDAVHPKNQLVGYWVPEDGAGALFPLHAVSPQWDTIIVSFASPSDHGPEGELHFSLPPKMSVREFKADIATLKHQGKTVLLSLGGGGQFFHLEQASQVPVFVHSVEQLMDTYGFEGIDLDFETPSLDLAPGDVDFRHPTTPSVVNLIAALREITAHYGPRFVLSLVPEGPQVAAGYGTYGGQFGSELPIIYALGSRVSFVDLQDYNTPPMEGLDGQIYQAHTVDYHAALAELLLQGFHVGGKSQYWFAPLAPSKVVVGFLVYYAKPQTVSEAMRYLMTGKAPAGTTYRLHVAKGYPDLMGAMFWDIPDDRSDHYVYSNLIGPQLHSAARQSAH